MQPLFEEACAHRDSALALAREAGHPVALSLDASTDVGGHPVLNFMATVQSRSWLVHAVHTDACSHTAEFLADQTAAMMDKHGPFAAIVTDNASNMTAARRIVRTQHPHILTYSCAAHSLNLLVHDVVELPVIRDVVRQVQDVATTVKAHHRALCTFTQLCKEYGGRALLLPSTIRWASQYRCIERMLEARAALVTLAASPASPFCREVRKEVLDSDHWWRRAAAVAALLKPVAVLLKVVETDRPTLAVLYQRMFDLQRELQRAHDTHTRILDDAAFNRCLEFVRNRWTRTMDHMPQLLAYVLHPALRGRKFTDMDAAWHATVLDSVRALICAQVHCLHPAELPAADKYTAAQRRALLQLQGFRARSGVFAHPHLWATADSSEPVRWWLGVADDAPELAEVAALVLGLPSSSAANERHWLAYRFVHSKMRNRLSPERAVMLSTVYWNHRIRPPPPSEREDGLSGDEVE